MPGCSTTERGPTLMGGSVSLPGGLSGNPGAAEALAPAAPASESGRNRFARVERALRTESGATPAGAGSMVSMRAAGMPMAASDPRSSTTTWVQVRSPDRVMVPLEPVWIPQPD